MTCTSGSRKINYASLATKATKPTLDELEVFLMLARTAGVPGDTQVTMATQKLSVEAIVEVTPTFQEEEVGV